MIIPAIIPRSLTHLEECLNKFAFAKDVQIDVVDGKFDDDISWPYEPKGTIQDVTSLIANHDIQVDLMIMGQVKDGREWLLSGAKSLVFHLEGVDDPSAAILLRKDFDFKLGFAISNDTALERLYPWIDKIDFVQLMGIKSIGAQGQPFDDRVIERVITLRHLYPKLTINVDGGVSEETIKSLADAGVTDFIVGSTLVKAEDPKLKYEELLKIVA